MNIIKKENIEEIKQFNEMNGELKDIGDFYISTPNISRIVLIDKSNYKEKGYLQYYIIGEGCNAHIQLDYFILTESSIRNHGIGKAMLEELVKFAKEQHITTIDVYPVPCGENAIDREELYQIYQKLGFEFTTESSSIKHMEMQIN